MRNFKNNIADILHGILNERIDKTEIYSMLEYPPESGMGDISLPCFKLAKLMKNSPVKIAGDLKNKLNHKMIKDVQAVNGYLNIFIKDEELSGNILAEIYTDGERYGSSTEGNGKTVVLDYSSPNIAKPFHVGHLRSTVIGNAVKNIYEFMGYDTVSINYIGDWGTQFGKVITAYKLWCNDISVIEHEGIAKLMELYVKFHDEAERDSSLNDTARRWFVKLEQGDTEALELWKRFKDISLEEYKKTYDLIDVKFDSYDGESFFSDKMPAVVEELKQKELLKIDDGASIVSLDEYNMPPCLILKRDGSTLYPTRDIAAALYRRKTYNFHKNIYVVGVTQSLHIAQFKKVLELMGYEWANDCIHVNFGSILQDGQLMGTRKGNTLSLDTMFREAIGKVGQIIEEKNPDLDAAEKEYISKAVGVGAIIFNDLSNGRIRDINFNWEDVLSFDGNSGPYTQYTYARVCGVLKKSELSADGIITGVTEADLIPVERELLKVLAYFPEKAAAAAQDYEPSVISRYILDICMVFNRFYNEYKILKAESNDLILSRLKLTLAVKIVLGNALKLIGLERTETV